MKQVKFAALFMGKDFSSKEHHVSFENAYPNVSFACLKLSISKI